jgi:hypothetical protein
MLQTLSVCHTVSKVAWFSNINESEKRLNQPALTFTDYRNMWGAKYGKPSLHAGHQLSFVQCTFKVGFFALSMIMCKIVFRSSTCSTKLSFASFFFVLCVLLSISNLTSLKKQWSYQPAAQISTLNHNNLFFYLTYAQGQTLQQNQATLCTISIINNFFVLDSAC